MSVGPVELVVLSFPGNDFRGEILPAIQRTVDAGIIRIIDVLIAIRVGDDPVRVLEMIELEDEARQRFEPIVADVTGLLTPDDAVALSVGLGPDSSAAVLLFEHSWAISIAEAVDRAGGEVILSERIPRSVVQQLVEEAAA